MAASKSQGSYFGLFLVGATVLVGGIAGIASATGKLLMLVGVGILLAAAAGFLKIKPLEGETPLQRSPEAMKWMGAGVVWLGWVVTFGSAAGATAYAQASAAPAQPAAAPAPVSPATTELREAAAKAPTVADLQKGDPGGTLTGSIADVTMTDAKAGPTLADAGNQIGQNKVAINFVWTLICGFLVMFMQAGFAMVESGLTRVKNANHTYMMNFFVYGCGLLAYWVIGFAIQMGGAAGNGNLGGLNPLAVEQGISLFGKTWGVFGKTGYFLAGSSYDVGVMVIFLFQMVFMDTALTIVTGACAERWKFITFSVTSVIMGALTYPLFANWAWGGGWLSQLGTNLGLGKGYADFAGSGVVHSVGGLTALAVCLIVGPRIGKFNRDGSANPIIGHDISAVLIGCFILAFGWFGFNPGSTLGASANGNLRIGTIAVTKMRAGSRLSWWGSPPWSAWCSRSASPSTWCWSTSSDIACRRRPS